MIPADWGRRAWLLALIPAALAVALRWHSGPGVVAEDYAQYILHGRALAEGRPYNDIGYIYTPFRAFVGPPAMPPGLPVVLAAGFTAGLTSKAGMAALMLAITFGFLAVAAGYARRREGAAVAFCVGALLLLGTEIASWAPHVQSDLLLGLLIWLIILLFDRDQPWSWWRVALVSALGLFAISVRPAGIALLPASLLYWLVRRKEVGHRPLAVPAAWITAALAAVLVMGSAFSVVRSARWLIPPPHFRWQIANLHTYKLSVFQLLLYPFSSDLANDLLHLVCAALLVTGAVLWWRAGGRRTFAAFFAICYFPMLVWLPFGEPRYLWPLYPLLLIFFARGVLAATRLVPALRLPGRAERVLAAVTLVMAFAGLMALSRRPPLGSFAASQEVQSLFAHLRASPDRPRMRLAFIKPRILALETGIPAMSIIGGAPDRMHAELSRLCISHVVAGSQGQYPTLDTTMQAMLSRHPGDFERVYDNRDFALYRFSGLPCRRQTSIFEGLSGPEVASRHREYPARAM